MKRNIQRIATLLSFATAAVFAAPSCTDIEEIQEPSVEGKPMYIVAEFNSTKTVNDGSKTYWIEGDDLAAIHNTTGSSTAYNDRFVYDSGLGKFTGTARSLGSSNDWYVVYPYNSSISKASEVPVRVNPTPAQSSAGSCAHLAGSDFTLFGKKLDVVSSEDGLNIHMANALSVARFAVTNTLSAPVTVTGIEFTSVNPISGDFTVDMTGESYVWTAGVNASKKVSLTVSGDATIAAGATATFYAGVAPHAIPAGSQLIVSIKANRNGKETVPCFVTKTISASTSFKSGYQKEIKVSYDENHTTDPALGAEGYKLVTSEPSDWSGKYIMVSADKAFVFTGDNGTGNRYTLQTSDLTGDVITKDCSAYEFEISKDGSNYYLKHGGQYLYCNYSGSGTGGNASTGMGYSSTKQALRFKIMTDGTFGFWMREGNTDQYIYYKSSSGYFKFGGSYNNHCVYLYKWNDGTTPVPPTPIGDKYVKVTSAPTSWDGTYLFVDESSSKAFAAFADVSNYAVSVTISAGTIAASSEIDKYALKVTATGKTHTNVNRPAYSVQNSNNKYIYYSSSAIQIADTDSRYNDTAKGDVVYNHCFDYLDGGVQVLSSGNYSGFNKYYLVYGSSKFSYSQTESHKIQLYKLESTTGKKSQALSFTNSSVSWTIGDTYKVNGTYSMPQTVSNAKTDVSYTSDNSSVATVSGTQITIKGTGNAKITANAVETDEYYSGSASYTLSITTGGAFNLENDNVKNYLDYMEAHPYNPSDYSYTYVDSYYSGTGTNNRLDYPKPVSLSWTGSNASKVTVYTNSTMTEEEMSQSVSGNSTDIYNLVPGLTYYWKVTNNSGAKVADGQFSTTGRRRMIKVSSSNSQSNANNCRDFGGQVTSSGKTVKYKKIYRGSNMDGTTSAEKSILKDYLKIKLDVDLRESTGRNPLNVTVSDQTYNNWGDLSNTNKMKATIGDIFTAVENNNAVYIHCAVGADRTGYVCLLLEAILGIPQERCDIDYEMTSFSPSQGARQRTSSSYSNYYYSSSGHGVHFIKAQSGSTFQEKAVNYVVNTLNISKERVTAFQNAMLQ